MTLGRTVALVGADGAGKTTVAHRLLTVADLRLTYIYMGVNPEASNWMLPTTRLWMWWKRRSGKATHQGGPPALRSETAATGPKRRGMKGIVGRGRRSVKSALYHGLRASEEWYRQLVVWQFQLRKFIVVFDRHFFLDYYAHEIAPDPTRPLGARLHGWMLATLYPRPHMVIVLDAPAEVLFARKPEGTVEQLEARRAEYFELRGAVRRFEVVDATASPDDVFEEVVNLIRSLQK